MFERKTPDVTSAVWSIGALCRAIADTLDARFNPVAVRGEISGFSRATSGHCYFSLKDETGQIRCAMFRRAATLLEFSPKDGELIEVRGRLGVYEQRGDLQLIVESMGRAGQGAMFEQFLKLKARLEAAGLFEAARKRTLPAMPRGIGVVTSLGAAALHDVVTVLQRRVPHIPVVIAPAMVQGATAPAELIKALSNLYRLTPAGREKKPNIEDGTSDDAWSFKPTIDVILLVRGGGSMEDLLAFNDEQLVRALAQSPVPVVSGVGHETDFTLADFVADLRAPTPTAAAELVAQARAVWQSALEGAENRLQDAVNRQIDQHSQRLDSAAARLGRPSNLMSQQRLHLSSVAQRLHMISLFVLKQSHQDLGQLKISLADTVKRDSIRRDDLLQRAELRLGLLDPKLVLRRGYAWLSSHDGKAISSVKQTYSGQALHATLVDGTVDLTVLGVAETNFLQSKALT
jgi:exodeoxyribonuclease VII large subunit